MSPLLRDPWFVATLDRAIAKHRECLTPRQIHAFRKQMAFTFQTHPKARAILAAARPDLVRRLAEKEPN